MAILNRCLECYLPRSVKLLLMKAELLEEMEDVESTKRFLETILEKKCPELLEAIVFYIELLLRHNDQDAAEELLERFTAEGTFIRSFVHSFIRSFVHSFIRSFVHSFIR